MSINLGLNIAMRALSTYTEAIDVTNHNIANMADPYYSRQVADISATIPMNMLGAAGQLGTGSMVSMIERMRDTFLDSQIQAEESNVGKWEELDRVYQLLSAVIPEVNGATNGLQSKIDAFFADWQALATAAAGGVTANIAAAQAVLISDSTALASSLNEIAADFSDIQLGLTTDLKAKIDSVNSYIQQIYEFNKEIKIAYGMGQIPNDLLDMRNEAITKLSELVNVNVQSKDDGTQIVTIAGKVLVNGGDYFNTLTTVAGNADPRLERVGLYQNGAIL